MYFEKQVQKHFVQHTALLYIYTYGFVVCVCLLCARIFITFKPNHSNMHNPFFWNVSKWPRAHNGETALYFHINRFFNRLLSFYSPHRPGGNKKKKHKVFLLLSKFPCLGIKYSREKVGNINTYDWLIEELLKSFVRCC